MRCSDAPAMGAAEGARHAGEESDVDVGLLAYLCLCYAPKRRNSGSRGRGEAAQGTL